MTKGMFASANDLRNVIASVFPDEAPPIQMLESYFEECVGGIIVVIFYIGRNIYLVWSQRREHSILWRLYDT